MAFERVCAVDEVPTDQALGVTVGDLDVAIAQDGGDYFAIQNECSHAAVALSEGWLHGSRFDLRTGKPTGLPATEPVAVFPVEVRDDEIYVDTDVTLNGVHPS
jgi:3-phenylpropionate/trans-cinnamate dioxygenase ferredoxin subunit